MTRSPFATSALALLAQSYSPLPIIPGDKLPGRFGEHGWVPMSGWTAYCTTPATPNKVRSWSLYTGAGVGVALGRGLVAIDIDRDDFVEPILAVLPPVVVAKRGRKGLTVFYQTNTTAILSRSFAGMVDILAHGKMTVLPPSRHPAGMPYAYTTARTLEDTRLDELPIFTSAHDAALVALLRERGATIPEKPAATPARLQHVSAPREAGSGELDDLKALALANPDAWVRSLGLAHIEREGVGYRAVAEWRDSGSGKATAARGRNLSIHPSGIRDFGTNEGFTPIDLVKAARGLETGDAIRWLAKRMNFTLASSATVPDMLAGQARSPAGPAPVIEAVYPDRRVPLDEAVAALREAIADAFAGFARYHVAKGAADRQHAAGVFAMDPKLPAILLRSEMAVGKTTIATGAIQAALGAIPAGETLVYCTPRIELGDDIAASLNALGVTAKGLRGRDQPDPDNLPAKMCLNPEAATDAICAGAKVFESVCERRLKGETPIRCTFFSQCGYHKQQKAEPQVWIIPSNRLFAIAPEAIKRPYALIIDEKFHTGATSAKADVLSLDEIDNAPLPRIIEDRPLVEAARRELLAVLRAHEDGPVTRLALADGGMTAEEAREAGQAEMRRWRDPGILPDMSPRERKRRVDDALVTNRGVKAIAGLFREVALFLEGDEPAAGRLVLTFDDKRKARVVRRRRLRHVDRPDGPSCKWSVPTLMLDGTAPPVDVLSLALGRPVEVRADVSAFWSRQGHVTQIIGAPESKAKLGRERAAKMYLRHIKKRAALAGARKIAVVAQEALIEKLEALGLPPNVETKHFNATAGSNDWSGEDVAGIIVIGRILPAPQDMEADAATLTGRPALPCQYFKEGANPFYDRVVGGIRLRDGSVVATEHYRHPDPAAEALRWASCEGESLQAIYRIRPHRRERPFFVDIFTSTPLPLVVDEVKTWDEAILPAFWDQADSGIILTSEGDAGAIYGLSRKRARDLTEGAAMALFPLETLYSEKGHCAGVREVRYKRHGDRAKETVAAILPNGPQTRKEMRQTLASLGRMRTFRLDGKTALDKAAADMRPRGVETVWDRLARDLRSRQDRLVALIDAAIDNADAEAA